MLRFIVLIVIFVLFIPNVVISADLDGSQEAIDSAFDEAGFHDFSFLSSEKQLNHFKKNEWLVPLEEDNGYLLHEVSYPYVRPAVRQFVGWLSGQFRDAIECEEELVVTSALRLTTRQPKNAVEKSVHPTGMAADFRIPEERSCERWLESLLRSLEDRNVIEATREHWPAHYHVVVYPTQYELFILAQSGADVRQHRVSQGETLSQIATAYKMTVKKLVVLNGLPSPNFIVAGQFLQLR